MLDPKKLRQSTQDVANNLARRGFQFDIDSYSSLNESRKLLQIENDNLKNKRNKASKEIGIAKSKGEDVTEILKLSENINGLLANNESKLSQILSQMEFIELGLPNLLSDRVPDGKNESDNEVIRSWGNKKEFSFPAKDHIELGSNLGLLDMDNAARISGSRFSVLRGNLASLQRALIQFMLDIHINEHGYEEFYVPFIVNSETLTGTSQLPKFESDLFKIESDKSSLI